MTIQRIVMVQSIPSIGQFYENVFHFDNPSGAMAPAAIGAELASNFMPKLQGFQSNFLGWQFCYIYDADNPLVPAYIHPLLNSPGLAGTGYLYPTTCLKIKWQADIGGRHGRGRTFVGGSRNDWATAGGITSSAATNGGILIGQILARYGPTGSSSLRMGLYTRASGTAHGFHQITSGIFNTFLGTQRRRNYGVGI